MFKDIVSRVPFSPALVGSLGFYARRLKKEEAVRRMGLIFTALALIVQSFAVFSPPESANAASEGDMIYGGISSKQEILDAYDRNTKFRNVMKYAGISRSDLKNTKVRTINNLDKGKGSNAWKSWGWDARYSRSQGEVKHSAHGTTVYSRPNYLFNNTAYERQYGRDFQIYYGHSSKIGEFGIMFDCGNLIAPKLPVPPPPPAPPAPKPAASCKSLSVIRENASTYRFRAQATLKDGATLSKYTFIVKNSSGTTVKNFDYKTVRTDVTTGRVNLPPGDYKASVVVDTSVGDRSGTDCKADVSVPKPGVMIEKKVDNLEHKTVKLGQQFSYQLVVKNTGKVPLENVVVTDEAPAGVTFTSASDGRINDRSWKASIALLNPGQSKSYTIKAQVPSYKAGTIKNTACVGTPTVPGDPDDCDEATVDVPEPEMKVCELATNKIITIKQSAYNPTRHSKNLADCTKIQVCDLTSGTIITIREPDFNPEKHSKDLSKCDDMQVCDLETGEVITIKKHQFDETRHSKDASDCIIQVASDKTATNLSQGDVDASTITAQAGDRIQYTVRLHNLGSIDATVGFSENIKDVVEYANLTHNGGGIFDEEAAVLSWGDVTLKPNEHTTRTFTVTLLDEIPVTARGTGDPGSYDCIMTNTFGNSVDVGVECGAAKGVETVVDQLPSTGPDENMLFAGIVGAIVIYFYARSRQLATEVRLIRRDINTGVL